MMKKVLLPLFSALVITHGLAGEPSDAVVPGGDGARSRAGLKVMVAEAVREGDLRKQGELIMRFRAVPEEWLPDATPLHEAAYDRIRSVIGTADENRHVMEFAVICQSMRRTGESPLFVKIGKDLERTNPYSFPEHLRMTGWPVANDPDQLKGVRGQFLATMVAVKGGDFIKEHVRKTAALAPDADDKLLGIWALGHSFLAEGTDYLKTVALSGSGREKALARSALNHVAHEMERRAKEGRVVDGDRLADVENFLSSHGLEKPVSAGEYYPF